MKVFFVFAIVLGLAFASEMLDNAPVILQKELTILPNTTEIEGGLGKMIINMHHSTSLLDASVVDEHCCSHLMPIK
jgi:hypothetical protein